MSCEIIAVTNQKGGVGKSTTAEALAEGLNLKGYKVLLIDMDAQGSISLTSKADDSKPTIYDLLTNKFNAQEVTQQRAQQADIIPSSQSMAHLELELTHTGKEHRLKEKLKPLTSIYDYIIIDTPPALGLTTVNALTAANSVIIPAQADIYSLQGIGQLYNTIEAIQEYTNPKLKIKGILLTRHNNRSILSRDMQDMTQETAERLNTFLYTVAIRENVSIREAQATKQSIFTYAPKSNAAVDYLAFIDEFLERGKSNE